MIQSSSSSTTYVYTFQAAIILGVCPRMVRCLMTDGKLTGYRRGRRLLVFKRRQVLALSVKVRPYRNGGWEVDI